MTSSKRIQQRMELPARMLLELGSPADADGRGSPTRTREPQRAHLPARTATVGINAGDGVNFFQIGRFDHEGVDYDGPGGVADGVSFLDNTRQCFLTGTIQNTPPIYLNPPTGCLMASVGVPIQLVQGELFDTRNGIHQGLATFADPVGDMFMTFPFGIDGM